MALLSDTTTLSRVPLFRDLAPTQLSQLATLLHARVFPAQCSIFSAGQPGEAVYIVVEGTIKIQVIHSDGTYVILGISGPGEVLGEMSVIDGLGHSADAVTIEETKVLWMDRATFHDCLKAMPNMVYNLALILSRRLRLASMHIETLATLDVYGRVAHQLVGFAQEYGEDLAAGGRMIPIRLTQSDLADLIGASRVRVNQVLSFYKQQKYITIDKNYRITVHDMPALRSRCR